MTVTMTTLTGLTKHGLTRAVNHVKPGRHILCKTTPRFKGSWTSSLGPDDYDAERVPEHFNFCTHVIDRWAHMEKSGELVRKLPAFWWVGDNDQEVKWSFSDLSKHSKRVANILTGPCGLQPGDRLICILPRIPEWWLISLACIRAGILLLPGTTQLSSKDIKHRIVASQSKSIVVSEDCADKVEEVWEDCPTLTSKVLLASHSHHRLGWFSFKDLFNSAQSNFKDLKTRSDDPMTIYFTSGTTGSPKMCEHAHAYSYAHYITGREWLDLTHHDMHWNLSDPGWAKSAFGSLYGPWIQGAGVFQTFSSSVDPHQTLSYLSSYPITGFCTVPTMYRMFVQENISKYNFRGLKHFLSAGEPLNPEVINTWRGATGHIIREGYGQTETVLQIGMFPSVEYKEGAMGKASPGTDMRIVNDEGEEVPPGVEGNIAIKVKPKYPPGLFKRYVDEPEKTAQCFKGDYYMTGDRGMKDDEDYMYFMSRSDDLIISAGYRIGPFEVESALIEHQAVAESAVVSSPDEIRGTVVKAFVVLTQEHQSVDKDKLTKELQEHVKRATAPYKYPRKIEYVDVLPKTVSGKIRRVELRE